ncbi:carbohydrate-binding domain-containing protein [Desulforamulus ruminis]|uniref:Dockerin type 1 n=1 Tax=Desulforamulus ruminis (strain ATCC 23193 / DSM 2154 / NCIMB 8452 / DL) TaxID=696281 RepID=F6DR18_DESRL|nr:carbohydrate-binding domain-containing protein [Desulforamulus ruminis]AEG59737.1 hypothetical protein Desru_1471 [Desulforamulus ruminis DSM 2154]
MKNRALRYLSLLLAALMTIAGFTGCAAAVDTVSSPAAVTDSATEINPIAVEYSREDLDGSWDASTATTITLKGSSFAVDGTGAAAEDRILTISAAGTYVFNGTLTDGQIVVDAGKDDTVRLVLNGANLSCSDSAPIYSKQADKMILTLADGTKNTVEDGTAYTYAEGEDEPDAAIFSQDDLTINGSGSLKVKGNFNNGIGTKDNLIITGGTLDITAAKDGLRGRDSIAIHDGTFNIEAGEDAIQSNNDEDGTKGWISLDGGQFTITAGNDGIQAETLLQVTAGEFTLTTGGGSANASTRSNGETRPGRGQWETIAKENNVAEDTVSAKGVKAGTGILITGGVFAIDSSDDAVHSNGNLVIKSGEFAITSGDDGIHADSALTVDDGSILISKCYEGLEGASITVNGGTIRLTARDDGLNAAGGNDGSSLGGRPGQNNFSANENYFIRITGGYVAVDASGDGIDSNGKLYFNGGTVLVNGPTSNGNGAMDYDGTCEVTGGTLAIAGSSGMAQAPGNTSTQNSLTVYYSSIQKAGTLVNLADESGKSILTFSPAKDYQSIVISTPDLKQGKTYTLSSGGSCSGNLSDGLYTRGAYSSGVKLTDVTISGTVTAISDDGSQVSGRMGGMPGPGGGGMEKRPGGRPMPNGGNPSTQ